MHNRQTIAEQLLSEVLGRGIALDADGCCECPGVERHTKANGRRDFRVVLDGAPTGYCFHSGCLDDVARFNRELRRRIWFAENGRQAVPAGHWAEGVAAAPKEQAKARPEIDRYQIWELTHGSPDVDAAWFRRRSPVSVESVESGRFLDHLYRPGERVLIFTDQKTQGDFLWCIPGQETPAIAGGYRLAQQRGVSAVPSALPKGAKEGVWFLVQPVSGQWAIKRETEFDPAQGRQAAVAAQYSRRSQGNVTAWRYYVLESDELDAATWLKILANLALPIAAIYTSGGRSVHALLKIEVTGKAEWDVVRNNLRALVCPLGADPAALTAVRLSRLPGCKRGDRLQELLYVNPAAEYIEPRLMPELRA